MGPGAQYLQTGSWPTPQMNNLWQSGQVPFSAGPGFPMPGFPTPYDPWGAVAVSPEQELDMLKGQAEMLEDELDGIRKRIGELEGGDQ